MSITLEAYLIPAEVIMNDGTIDGGGGEFRPCH